MREPTLCSVELQALFNCWRAFAVDDSNCVASMSALNTCMKAKQQEFAGGSKKSPSQLNELNHWLRVAFKGKTI
ncbi:hypothetical protein HK098_005599 [Nowakowskiella sp. JEL0407]|nr:hypothetical protein HK098_005599 [Nowakowskiella sp. JEL0407]